MVSSNRKHTALPPRRRAVSDDMKDRRRTDVLAAAMRLLEQRPFEDISVAAIARECGLAKGTLYLYFRTREALFMALLEIQYMQWFDTLDAQLAHAGRSASTLARGIAGSLHAQPMFVRLIGVLHGVLEHNVPVPQVVRFKRQLLKRAAAAGEALETALELPAGAGLRLLLWLQAVVPGLAQMAAPPPPVRQALDRDASLAVLEIDFVHELDAMLNTLLRGLRTRAEDL